MATIAFNALNKAIDSIIKLQYFSNYKSSPYREIAKNNSKLVTAYMNAFKPKLVNCYLIKILS